MYIIFELSQTEHLINPFKNKDLKGNIKLSPFAFKVGENGIPKKCGNLKLQV